MITQIMLAAAALGTTSPENRPKIGTCNVQIGVAKLGEKRNSGRID